MNILVTGATGHLGKRLLAHLRQMESFNIFGLSRRPDAILPEGICLKTGDLLDVTALIEATRDIDTIVHLAAVTHSDNRRDYDAVNYGGTLNLVQAAQENRVKKIIFISSRTASLQGGAYAVSKYQAEKAIADFDQDWLILSPSEIYGAGIDEALSKVVGWVKKTPVLPIPGRGNYRLSPVLVDDVIEVIITALIKNGNRKKYILAGPEEFTLKEIIKLIAIKLNRSIILLPVPIALITWISFLLTIFKINLLVPDQIARLAVCKPSDIEPARTDFKFDPVRFEVGLNQIIGGK